MRQSLRQGMIHHEIIAAAKGGLEGMVQSAAITYAQKGIRFNAVVPGLTETPLAAPPIWTSAVRAFSESVHPLGRLGRPDEVAAAIAFLLVPTPAG